MISPDFSNVTNAHEGIVGVNGRSSPTMRVEVQLILGHETST